MGRPRTAPGALGRLALSGLASVLLVAVVVDSAQAAPRSLATGFADGRFKDANTDTRELWFERAVAAGTRIIRLGVRWSEVASDSKPPDRQADPSSPGYDWEAIDAEVRSAAEYGLPVMFTVVHAPRWAEGPNRPPDAGAGTWKPSAAAYGRFGRAIATRYSGSYPDPERPGQSLPRVRFYEAWNEPNLDQFLAPQWNGKRSVGPGRYRRLLDRFYRGVKSAQRGAKVIAPATAPYGDLPGGARTPPVQFLRRLFCLRGPQLKRVRCPVRARFDILSHHPINSVAGPRRKARNPLDASTSDMHRLTRVVRRAEKLNLVAPRQIRRPVWATELWWETDPPDPILGIPPPRQARYMNIAQYVLWQQGVRVALFLPMVDAPDGPNIAVSLQAGIYYADGKPKPSFTVFRFPFVAQRLRGNRALVWGKAPHRGRFKIQRRAGGKWRTIARAQGRPGIPFNRRIRLRGTATLRAVGGGIASRPMRLRARRRQN